MVPAPDLRPIVILGAGINGCALARELVLNRQPVWLIDTGDLAGGTTAYSSRLIHGGLRYLEYGEFDLVRESLAERTRLLRLAPHLVRPLELFVPVTTRIGGLWVSARRFLRWPPQASTSPRRGQWLVRMGLWLYDLYARDPSLPRHRVLVTGDPSGPPVDARKYRWLCAYYDTQLASPERFVVALVEDARRAAAENGTEFRVWTYHRAWLDGKKLSVGPWEVPEDHGPGVAQTEPALVVNATGAWVDETLARLHVASPRLLGGTKGSHLFTRSETLRRHLAGRGLYAEAADGRPVFVLPLADGTLVGTTDERYEAPPETAVASEAELDYLVGLVNDLLPQVGLTRGEVVMHYSGVRPLPASRSGSTAAITRRHFLQENPGGPVPLYSILGGKLTTCRSLAAEATEQILARLGRPVVAHSRERVLPGGENYPRDAAALEQTWNDVADRTGFSPAQVRATWQLLGSRTAPVLASLAAQGRDNLDGTELPRALVRWIIAEEWVTHLSDLVERRLMLLFAEPLGRQTLDELAQLLVEAGLLAPAAVEAELQTTIARLAEHFGKRVLPRKTAEAGSQTERARAAAAHPAAGG